MVVTVGIERVPEYPVWHKMTRGAGGEGVQPENGVMLEIMFRRFSAVLLFAELATLPLLAQHPPLPLCLVQTKPDASTQYDPSAGPWAMEMYKQLSAQNRTSGVSLHITVLAASTQKDLLPEIHRLQCPWVVQLWYQHDAYLDLSQAGVSTDGSPAFDPQFAAPPLSHGRDSVLFALWNGSTGKVIARGAAPVRLIQSRPIPPLDSLKVNPKTCAALTQQIIKHLNKLP